MVNQRRLSRRIFVGGCIGITGLATSLMASSTRPQSADASSMSDMSDMSDMFGMSDMSGMATVAGVTPSMVGLPYTKGDVSPSANGFDPFKILTDFDPGKVTKLSSGQTLRDYTFVATNKNIVYGPGVSIPSIVYNGRLPGPSLRVNQGDFVRITFTNRSKVAQSLNVAGLLPSNPSSGRIQDKTFQLVPPGGQAVYTFNAAHFGLYTYQAFANPMALTAFKGPFGMIIVDPVPPRRPAPYEFVMVMSGCPRKIAKGVVTPVNNIYAINAVAFQFFKHPITIKTNQLVRIYLTNATEFDRINSFHLHGNLFNFYRSGTSLKPDEYTDTIILSHGQSAILEFTYTFPGQYMFHAHQAIFSDEGWLSTFNVVP
jgi:FtsP/CotA-like multicopper oxidase with cupredoxin domain